MATNITAALHTVHRPRFVLVSDLDHTMVQNEDVSHERLQMFNKLWSINFGADSLLIFSTGRSPRLFRQLWDEAPLLTPNVLICSVGTEIFYRTAGGSLLPDKAWDAHLDAGWDRGAAEAVAAAIPQLKRQVDSEQRRHKLSYHLTRATPDQDAAVLQALRDGLASQGLAAKVIYSGGVDVDVLAQGAGKGKALEFILRELKEAGLWPSGGVQVNGDSGNDIELFEVPGVRGCVVANAHPELRQFAQGAVASGAAHIAIATQPCAGGIVQALLGFGSVPSPPPRGALLRGMVAQLGTLQSNALGGSLGPLAAPGASWVLPSGRVVDDVQACGAEPADAAARGLAWVDNIAVRALLPPAQQRADDAAPAGVQAADGNSSDTIQPGQLLLVLYQLWSFAGAARDSGRVRQCSAVVQAVSPDAADGYRLLHLHESVMTGAATPTGAFDALAAAGSGGGV